jgi:hypothetical protein
VLLESTLTDTRLKALVANDLAALAACDGDFERARSGFESALERRTVGWRAI